MAKTKNESGDQKDLKVITGVLSQGLGLCFLTNCVMVSFSMNASGAWL